MTLLPKQTRHWWNFFQKDHPLGVGKALLSIVLFAVYYIIAKHTFNTQGFLAPFVIARIGTFLGVSWYLTDRVFRKHLKKFIKKYKFYTPLGKKLGNPGIKIKRKWLDKEITKL